MASYDDNRLSRSWGGGHAQWDQATADQRIPILLQTPAAVRWVSAEPLLDVVPVSEEM